MTVRIQHSSRERAQKAFMKEARKIFMDIDNDGNGVVSAKELQAGMRDNRTMVRILSRVPPHVRKTFEQIDSDYVSHI